MDAAAAAAREKETPQKRTTTAETIAVVLLNGKKSIADFVSLSPANSKSTREANEVEEIVLVRSGSPRTVSDPQGWGVQQLSYCNEVPPVTLDFGTVSGTKLLLEPNLYSLQT